MSDSNPLLSVGDISWDTWRGVLSERKSPILDDGSVAYNAAKPHTAVCLAVILQKSFYADNDLTAIRNRNPFQLVSTGSFAGLLTFSTWSDAITYWKEHSFPGTSNCAQDELWEIVRDTEHIVSLDKNKTYAREVSGYLDENGGPTDETLRRWFGYNADEFPSIFRAWCGVGADIGLYPPVHEVTVLENGVEILFLNGIRMFESNNNVRVFGYSK